ncbi:MAG TPA: hypothetical protein VNW29_00600 [Candidatus Sulfotelmatobacter sp.]|jgi:hypothetical protein|nr:hypothetical protein [Candidatus Sulfotelmatobacter sp.]
MKKQKLNISTIENTEVKQIDLQQHRHALRKSLLTSPYWEKQPNIFIFFLKGGENIMLKNKIATAGIAFTVVAVIFVSINALLPKNTTAYAEQLAQQSYQKVVNLTPGQLDILKQKVHMDPSELLQEAKNAKDLKALTYDQFVNEYPMIKMGYSTQSSNATLGALPPHPDTEILDMHSLKFLAFTDANGQKVVVGIDQNNFPVFAFSTGKNGEMNMTVHDQGGNGGNAFFGTMKYNSAKPQESGISSSDAKNGPMRVQIQMNDGGKTQTITVNGKNYAVPAGVDLSTGVPQIQQRGANVYINGVKATPAE